MARSLGIGLVILGLLYPVLIYYSLGRLEPRWLALGLAGLWLLRAALGRASQDRGRIALLAAIACALLAVGNDAATLRWYPVLVNLAFLAVFGASLVSGPPLVERLARLTEPDLDARGQRYTRTVTQVWCGFFLLNGSVCAALALWGSWHWWAFYTGLLSYVLIALLMAGEWLVRQHLRNRAAVQP